METIITGLSAALREGYTPLQFANCATKPRQYWRYTDHTVTTQWTTRAKSLIRRGAA